MPDVVWTLDANTLTFDQGILSGAPHGFDLTGVVTERLAGGAVASYDLGISDVQTIDYTFPHVTQAKLDAAITWKDSTAKKALNTFTHTDNTKSPAYVKTVRLVGFDYSEEFYADPTVPRYRLTVRLQVEPT